MKREQILQIIIISFIFFIILWIFTSSLCCLCLSWG